MKIEYIRLACAVLITLNHSTGYSDYPDCSAVSRTVIDFALKYSGIIAMSMFFFMTGFLLFRNVKTGGVKDFFGWYKNTLKKRVFSLLIPYLLWNLIWTVFAAAAPMLSVFNAHRDQFEGFDWTWRSLFEGIFLYKYNARFWYIACIMVLIILSPVIYGLFRNRYLGVVVLCIQLIVTVYVPKIRFLDWLFNEKGYFGMFFFMAGAWMAIHHFSLVNLKMTELQEFFGGILFPGGIILYYLFQENGKYRLFTAVSALIIIIGLWMAVDFFRKFKYPVISGTFFFAYAIHFHVERFVNKLFEIFLPPVTGSAMINTFGGVFIASVIMFGTAVVVRKYLPRLFAILNGGRSKYKG